MHETTGGICADNSRGGHDAMNHRISRRMIAIFVVLLLTSIIATSVAAMGLALRGAQESSRQEELRKMGCDIVDVELASRVLAEDRANTGSAMYHAVGLVPAFAGMVSVPDIMMQSFLWAGEFPMAVNAPSTNPTRAYRSMSTFSPTDLEVMWHLPGVRDVWDVVKGVQTVSLDIGGMQRNVISLPMRQGQLILWNFTIERGRDFAPGDGTDAVIIGRTLADLLFSGEDPVGKRIPGTVVSMHVIGILALRESAAGAATGYISPYSDPNFAIFRTSVASGSEGEAQILQLLTEPGAGPDVAKAVQRMFRSKENADTTVQATSRNDRVPSVVGITVRTRTLSLLTSYALLTLIGCLLAVVVSLYTEFATRVRTVAVRRALGASRRSVTLGFMAEGMLNGYSRLGGFQPHSPCLGTSMDTNAADAAPERRRRYDHRESLGSGHQYGTWLPGSLPAPFSACLPGIPRAASGHCHPVLPHPCTGHLPYQPRYRHPVPWRGPLTLRRPEAGPVGLSGGRPVPAVRPAPLVRAVLRS